MLFDTHAHLCDEKFLEDQKETIERLRKAGVECVISVGDGARDPMGDCALAQEYDFIYWAAGVHPHDASLFDEARAKMIENWMAMPKCVALGEIGLDYHYDLSPRDTQKDVFDRQLEMAYALQKSVILHIREAHGDAIDIMTARKKAGRLPKGVMHCYSGSWESAKTYLDMGLNISFTGSVTFKNAEKLREVARQIPQDRIMVETDCPYMTPVPLRGTRNEPAFVEYTAKLLAELRGVEYENFARQCAMNGYKLFGIGEGNTLC